MCSQWKWGSFMGIARKAFQGPVWKCGLVVGFTEVEVNAKGCPRFSSIPSWRKANHVFNKAKTRPVPRVSLSR